MHANGTQKKTGETNKWQSNENMKILKLSLSTYTNKTRQEYKTKKKRDKWKFYVQTNKQKNAPPKCSRQNSYWSYECILWKLKRRKSVVTVHGVWTSVPSWINVRQKSNHRFLLMRNGWRRSGLLGLLLSPWLPLWLLAGVRLSMVWMTMQKSHNLQLNWKLLNRKQQQQKHS